MPYENPVCNITDLSTNHDGSACKCCSESADRKSISVGYKRLCGNEWKLGYELDLGNLKDEELEYVKEQIQCYKMIRPVIQHGDFYRIRNPFNENLAAWNFVSQDQKRAVAFFFEILSQPAAPVRI